MNNSKKGITVIIFLIIILIGVVGVGSIKSRIENKKDSEEYASSVEASLESNASDEADGNIDPSKVTGLFEKLKTKQDVKVLMLGDSIAMSVGKTSDNGIWSDGIKNSLEKEFGSKVTLELSAKKDDTTAAGLEYVQKNDISSYDLLILCYGYGDSKAGVKLEDVKNNYKAIVEKVHNSNPNITIISVLESILEVNNSYRSAISEVATTNSLLVADMKNAFISSGIKESSLANNGFPNDRGYQIYTQTIENKIKQSIG